MPVDLIQMEYKGHEVAQMLRQRSLQYSASLACGLLMLPLFGCSTHDPAPLQNVRKEIPMSAMTEKGLKQLHAGDFQAALETFKNILAGNDTNLEALTGCGCAYLALGNADEAQSYFELASKVNREDVRARIGKSLVHALKQNAIAAADEVTAAMRLSPAASLHYLYRSHFGLQSIQEPEQFVENRSKQLLAEPRRIEFYLDRAHELNMLDGDHKAFAVVDLSVAMILDPENIRLLEKRADYWPHDEFDLAGWSRAADDWSRILELMPQHRSALKERAWALYFAGRYDEAIRDINVLEQREPRNPDHFDLCAAVHMGKKEWADAISNITTALKLADEGEELPNYQRGSLFHYRAQSRIAVGEVAGAILDLTEALPLVDRGSSQIATSELDSSCEFARDVCSSCHQSLVGKRRPSSS